MAAARAHQDAGSRPRSGAEIREAFLSFFAQRGHRRLASASLVPDDPTVLLTIAGMLPFKPVFLGQAERPAARATTSQKCIRTNDIENVGRTARHHTFFEMLGNFSFGDYFKTEAIQWAWQLSTEVFGLNPANLVVSVFREDDEAAAIWRDLVGVNPQRIIRMDEADNFWASGPTGPCGPCSEIYYDFKPENGDDQINLEDDSRFIEFYNLVFMQYSRDAEGKLTPLANRNIDTGMGLERMAQILQGVPNNYETDLIFPIVQRAAEVRFPAPINCRLNCIASRAPCDPRSLPAFRMPTQTRPPRRASRWLATTRARLLISSATVSCPATSGAATSFVASSAELCATAVCWESRPVRRSPRLWLLWRWHCQRNATPP
jgi:alanyl-tRNA synthetase